MPRKKKRSATDLVNSLLKKASSNKQGKNNRIESLWNPYKDGITFSFLSKFFACPERTRLGYVEGWRPKSFKVSMEFGNIFHEMKDVYYSTGSMVKATNSANRYVDRKIKRNKATSADIVELDQLRALSHTTFTEYVRYWNANPSFQKGRQSWTDDKINWVHLERKFKFPFRLSNGKVIKLTGKIDGEFIDPTTGKKSYRVLENKTKQKVEEVNIERALKKDAQTMMYLIANKDKYKSTPAGVLYNVIRRTGMKPHKNEEYSSYCERIGSDIRSRPDFYFMRWHVDITQEDIDIFVERTLDPQLCKIVNWWESIKDNPFNPWSDNGVPKKNDLHYERPFGLYENNQRDPANDFAEIIEKGDYSMYEQRDVCFPELEEE
jgi:hypothetical protein